MKKIICLILVYVVAINISPMTLFAVSDDAYISDFKGDVKIIKQGTKTGIPCEKNMSLKPGDWVSTGKNSSVDIGYIDKLTYMSKIGENSLIEIKSGKMEWLEIYDGSILTRLRNMPKGEEFLVKTPSGVCGARGTGWQIITDGFLTSVKVFESKVFFRAQNPDGSIQEKEVWIEEGFGRNIKRFQAPSDAYELEGKEKRDLWENANSFPDVGETQEGIVIINGVGVNRNRVVK